MLNTLIISSVLCSKQKIAGSNSRSKNIQDLEIGHMSTRSSMCSAQRQPHIRRRYSVPSRSAESERLKKAIQQFRTKVSLTWNSSWRKNITEIKYRLAIHNLLIILFSSINTEWCQRLNFQRRLNCLNKYTQQ